MPELHDPLSAEEHLELAVLLDNVEEHLKVYAIDACSSQNERYRILLRRWVDRLCE